MGPEVPKVTDLREDADLLLPSARGADQTVGYETEPEVDGHPEVEMKRTVPGHGRERRSQDEIRDIA